MKKVIIYFFVTIFYHLQSIILFPITFIILNVAISETFIGDPVPKYWTKWLQFLELPKKLLK